MTTHVFIVDERTFPVHLGYMFAGTGARNHDIDFNGRSLSRLPPSTERNLVGMMADAGRVRTGDQVVFYLQASASREGLFFGVFQVAEGGSWLDRNDGQNYLLEKLGKPLIFRTMLTYGDFVYPLGVTEWEALDEIKNIHAPHQMLWSLIYRKLKANRGNTMITHYEAERLVQLIRNKNGRRAIEFQGNGLTYDADTCRIVCAEKSPARYCGRKERLDILPRLCQKARARQVFEVHLQAYITGSLGRGKNKSLDGALLLGNEVDWLGNEVSCGVGMQRIDVMFMVREGRQRLVVPVELKATPADESVVRQLRRYVEWIEQYFVPNCQSDIQPMVVALKPAESSHELLDAFLRFNAEMENRCRPIRYVEFEVDRNDLFFRAVDYARQ